MSRKLVELGGNRRRGRVLMPAEMGGCYHLISRAAFGKFMLESAGERQMFLRMLRKQAGFCGVEVLAFCVMSNHVHLLVRVLPKYEDELSDDVLVERYRLLYGGHHVPLSSFDPDEVEEIFAEDGERARVLRRALKARMGDVTVFMRELKQRYAIWYNAAHKNKGAIWDGRFRSQLIEDNSSCLQMVAAYIDLNPVRAEMVQDPQDYKFCSYGSAMSGNADAQSGYRLLFDCPRWDESLLVCKKYLYAKGANAKVRAVSEQKKDKGTIPEEVAQAAMQERIQVSMGERLHRQFRHLSEAGALGTEAFVERAFELNRSLFTKQRESGSRRIRSEKAFRGFRVLRDLQ